MGVEAAIPARSKVYCLLTNCDARQKVGELSLLLPAAKSYQAIRSRPLASPYQLPLTPPRLPPPTSVLGARLDIMARKGRATVKTPDKYITVDSDAEDDSPSAAVPERRNSRRKPTRPEGGYHANDEETESGDLVASRHGLNLSKAAASGPQDGRRQPRQEARAGGQSTSLADSLFPDNQSDTVLPSIEESTPHTFFSAAHPRNQNPQLTQTSRPRTQNRARRARATSRARGQGRGRDQHSTSIHTSLTQHTQPNLTSEPQHRSSEQSSANPPLNDNDNTSNPDMSSKPIQGGAYIPPNQQRNMRACMVCSIVRTQQQFLTEGCPNCEDVLELAGNPEQINDCTSQVFDGLITVADTSRSWVARYQRLEGYRPGVYATQVEGILPEDVLGAVESAGINYVPRDGSEQDTLPRD